MSDKKTPSLSCHCGQHKYSFKVPLSSLPIKQRLCHCDISRRISGCLFTSYFPIPSSNAPPDTSGLTEYESSDILSRYFCSTCSTHLYCRYNSDGHFEASHGTIVGKTDDLFDFAGHWWIQDTKDGGGSVWLKDYRGTPMSRWSADWHQGPKVPLHWRSTPIPVNTDQVDPAERLRVHCHCNGVDFYISRPDESSLKAVSPWPDLLVPWNSGKSDENPENKPWWLSTDRSKYLAGNCSCDSCRLIAGFDIVQWAFVPVANLSLPDGKPYALPFGKMKPYDSSVKNGKTRTRWFCSGCGAHVLYTSEERPTLVDIAVGLLDAPSGARAEEWLQWDLTDRVSFKEDAHNVNLVRELENGMKGSYSIGNS